MEKFDIEIRGKRQMDKYQKSLNIYELGRNVFIQNNWYEARKYFDEAIELFLELLRGDGYLLSRDSEDNVLNGLSLAYYLRSCCNIEIAGRGDAALKDCISALEADGQRLLRNMVIKANVSDFLGYALEFFYRDGDYKRASVVCDYIERFIDPSIVHERHYKMIREQINAGSEFRAIVNESIKNYRRVHAVITALNVINNFLK